MSSSGAGANIRRQLQTKPHASCGSQTKVSSMLVGCGAPAYSVSCGTRPAVLTACRAHHGCEPLGAMLTACALNFGRIAQLVRAPASHAGGPWFESTCDHPLSQCLATSSGNSVLLFRHPGKRDCRKSTMESRHPAKAGGECQMEPMMLVFQPWIPAFAGMTNEHRTPAQKNSTSSTAGIHSLNPTWVPACAGRTIR